MARQATCECGYIARGETEDEVVDLIQEHLRSAHPQLLAQQRKDPEELVALFAAAGFQPYRIRNDYWAVSYLSRQPAARPERLRAPIRDETVLVFSRRDEEAL